MLASRRRFCGVRIGKPLVRRRRYQDLRRIPEQNTRNSLWLPGRKRTYPPVRTVRNRSRRSEEAVPSEARSPSDKAKVSRTFIGGSIPSRASKINMLRNKLLRHDYIIDKHPSALRFSMPGFQEFPDTPFLPQRLRRFPDCPQNGLGSCSPWRRRSPPNALQLA